MLHLVLAIAPCSAWLKSMQWLGCDYRVRIAIHALAMRASQRASSRRPLHWKTATFFIFWVLVMGLLTTDHLARALQNILVKRAGFTEETAGAEAALIRFGKRLLSRLSPHHRNARVGEVRPVVGRHGLRCCSVLRG